MIPILYYLFQQISEEEESYPMGADLEHFLGQYGIYIGATLLVLLVLIILYIKKHRQSNDNE
tara:strand:+ start:1263 stop:1448 length:186 start_codon:yes stop_codon:yes gene_type:complete